MAFVSASLSLVLVGAIGVAAGLSAQPYSRGENDPSNPFDAPVPGFVGPDGIGQARLENIDGTFQNPDNFVNPIFFGWAGSVVDYSESETISAPIPQYKTDVLGPTTGEVAYVLSLGDVSNPAAADAPTPGSLTIELERPIRDLPGADLVVFENAYASSGGAGTAGETFAELAFIEVSSNGITFFRFPAISNAPPPADPNDVLNPYRSLDPTGVYNLAGKHHNSYGESWGTPFDLATLNSPAGLDLTNVRYVRIVDIPGTGDFLDSLGQPIYDPHRTFGTGGADIEAVGAVSAPMVFADWPQVEPVATALQAKTDDGDGDGLDNGLEYAFGSLPWDPRSAHHPFLSLDPHPVSELPMPTIHFVRDERLRDVRYIIEWSDDLIDWDPVAIAEPFGPIQPQTPFDPEIGDTSASEIASLGVLRNISVSSGRSTSSFPYQYMRLRIEWIPVP